MKLMVTADDFGWSPDTIAATIRALEAGIVTNASLMPAAPYFRSAADYAVRNPEYCYGVHLTLGGDGVERPVSRPDQVPGLVDARCAFVSARRMRRRAVLGRLQSAELEREVRAQLDTVRDLGVRIDYVDSHKHLHKLPTILRTLLRVLPDYGVRRLRRVQNIWIRRPLGSPTYWLGPLMWPRTPGGFVSSDGFYMPASLGETGWAQAILALDRTGIVEVGVHPGATDAWREAEARDAASLAAEAADAGVRILSWREAVQSP